MERVFVEERAFYTKVKRSLQEERTALEVRYHVEVNPVNKTKIHHIINRFNSLIEEIEDILKPYWE